MSRAPEILARWDGQSLRAVGMRDREAIAAHPPGTMFALRMWEEGSQAARAFISVFIEIAAENTGGHISDERLKGLIKETFGWITGERIEADGSKAYTFKSIGKMTKVELAQFTDQAKLFVSELGLDPDAIAEQAMERIRPKRAQS